MNINICWYCDKELVKEPMTLHPSTTIYCSYCHTANEMLSIKAVEYLQRRENACNNAGYTLQINKR
jgi:hypothetical protein